MHGNICWQYSVTICFFRSTYCKQMWLHIALHYDLQMPFIVASLFSSHSQIEGNLLRPAQLVHGSTNPMFFQHAFTEKSTFCFFSSTFLKSNSNLVGIKVQVTAGTCNVKCIMAGFHRILCDCKH